MPAAEKLSPYEYAVLWETERFPVGDEDREWVAVFIVLAASGPRAQAWGDYLAARRARSQADPLTIKRASVEPHVCSTPFDDSRSHACMTYVETQPVVVDGEEAADEHIGW